MLGRFSGAIALLLVFAAACSSSTSSRREPAATGPALSDAEIEASFVAFESGQVRPLALSQDGRYLYATNTPDNRLEVLRVTRGGLEPVGSVFTGLEPVAVAVATDGRVWVVNHVSDSVSIVDVSRPTRPFVARTLLVGDEPSDIVFAGPGAGRAFISAAHRGQNGRDAELTKPNVGRADVWVFDAQEQGTSLPGDAMSVVTLFSDSPRALAVSADGNTVYAAAFRSGNRTSSLNMRFVVRGDPEQGGGLPPPRVSGAGNMQPNTGLIVKQRPDPHDGKTRWLDSMDRAWDTIVPFNLPDRDLFEIDAAANPPVAGPTDYMNVGTVLFNLAVNKRSRKIYVSNTDARNEVRFEGHNKLGPTQGAPPGSVRGHFVESRITVIDPATGAVEPRHLNKHVDYSRDGTPEEAENSLALPTSLAVSEDGSTLYVAALGSSRVGVFATAELEDDSFVPSASSHVHLSGGGPTGLLLDERAHRLYVLTRFDNAISIVDPAGKVEIAHVPLFNPEPPRLVKGRHFLYDALRTSSHGDSSCAGCHVFGHTDGLGWDLGDPDGLDTPVPGPFVVEESVIEGLYAQAIAMGLPGISTLKPFAHMTLKGPMVTQSMRGMANHGAMHWRGDRTGGTDETLMNVLPSAQPDTGSFDEKAAFVKFNAAFAGLLGRTASLSDEDIGAFADFALQLMYPPNAIRNLDGSYTPEQQAGHDFFFKRTEDDREFVTDSFHNCAGCHVLDPKGNAEFGVAKPGFFGTDGRYMLEPTTQFFKVPHLRNLYDKIGMFSVPGNQVRGFGYLHEGSFDTVFTFMEDPRFVIHPDTPLLPANPGGFPAVDDPDPVERAKQAMTNATVRRQVEAFCLVFDSNLAPIVGQQVTLTENSRADALDRVDLLEARAGAGDCELVAHVKQRSGVASFLFDSATRSYVRDASDAPNLAASALRELAQDDPVTFTAVPPGSGRRIGLDRDLDGVLDADE